MVEITQQALKERLAYCPDTGVFTYRVRSGTKRPGDVTGCLNKGYLTVWVCGKLYGLHRLAWLYVHGVLPSREIDHINKNPSDNRIGNLRECEHAQNMQNKRRYANNTSGHTGVVWNKKSQRWQAQIHVAGRNNHLGFFQTKEAAITARLQAEPQYHPFFVEVGR